MYYIILVIILIINPIFGTSHHSLHDEDSALHAEDSGILTRLRATSGPYEKKITFEWPDAAERRDRSSRDKDTKLRVLRGDSNRILRDYIAVLSRRLVESKDIQIPEQQEYLVSCIGEAIEFLDLEDGCVGSLGPVVGGVAAMGVATCASSFHICRLFVAASNGLGKDDSHHVVNDALRIIGIIPFGDLTRMGEGIGSLDTTMNFLMTGSSIISFS